MPRITLTSKTCLSRTHPDLVPEWHSSNVLTPNQVTAGSHKKVWWICPTDTRHSWLAAVKHRALANQGCPYCAGKLVDETNCLTTLRPDLAQQWDFAKNTLKPTEVTVGSNKKVWWICPTDTRHSWLASVKHRALNDRGCPYCAGKLVDETNCLTTLRPDLAQQWDFAKNTLKPTEVTVGSNKKVWWICPTDTRHSWFASVKHRALNDRGCPSCTGTQVDETNCLTTLRPDLAQQWDFAKNTLKPTEVTVGSNKMIWWTCSNHAAWRSSVKDRNGGTGCPECGRASSIRTRSRVTSEFVELAAIIHHGRYEYLRVVYEHQYAKVEIICSRCHDSFWQMPKAHLLGQGCRKCARAHRHEHRNQKGQFDSTRLPRPILSSEQQAIFNKLMGQTRENIHKSISSPSIQAVKHEVEDG